MWKRKPRKMNAKEKERRKSKKNRVPAQKHTIFSTEWCLFYIKLLQRLSNALEMFYLVLCVSVLSFSSLFSHVGKQSKQINWLFIQIKFLILSIFFLVMGGGGIDEKKREKQHTYYIKAVRGGGESHNTRAAIVRTYSNLLKARNSIEWLTFIYSPEMLGCSN